MKAGSTSVGGVVMLALCLAAGAAAAQDLTWAELLRHPEHWPAQCAMKKPLQFQSGKSVRAGQIVNVLEMHPDEIVVGTTGGLSFGTKPGDTDALAVANAAYAKLTPKQRELTYASVLKRPDLWPWQLKLTQAFELNRKRLNKGDPVYLMAAAKGELIVCPATFDLHTEVKPEDTDILLYARKYVDNKDGAPGRLVEELRGKLINAATGAPDPLDTNVPPRYFVIYHGARWCPYTQKFTPDLLKLYKEMKPKHPEFEVIYVPAEKSAAELQQYAKEMDFPWPAIDFQKKKESAVLAWILGRSSTPELGVLDRYGNVVIDSATVDRDTALKQLAVLWNQPPAPK
jgi:thiol-disulfide isomerase/thioredoxin